MIGTISIDWEKSRKMIGCLFMAVVSTTNMTHWESSQWWFGPYMVIQMDDYATLVKGSYLIRITSTHYNYVYKEVAWLVGTWCFVMCQGVPLISLEHNLPSFNPKSRLDHLEKIIFHTQSLITILANLYVVSSLHVHHLWNIFILVRS